MKRGIALELERELELEKSMLQRQGQLFMAIAEELKLPLLHIARMAELDSMSPRRSETHSDVHSDVQADIQATADMSLQLLDSYMLGLRLSLRPEAQLALEPVSVASVLHDTAAALKQVAAQYGVELQLHVDGRYEPVLANRRAFQSAMVSLGYSLIEALPAAGVEQMKLQLAAHRTKYGIVAGLYAEIDGLTPSTFRRSFDLQGHVRQPLVPVMPGSGAGVFIADSLFGAMSSKLRVGRFRSLPGFAVTLPASEQLQLV